MSAGRLTASPCSTAFVAKQGWFCCRAAVYGSSHALTPAHPKGRAATPSHA